MKLIPGFGPGNLFLTKEALYLLSYISILNFHFNITSQPEVILAYIERQVNTNSKKPRKNKTYSAFDNAALSHFAANNT